MRRTATLAATGWLAAAVAATVAGVAVVTLVGRSLVGPEPDGAMSQEEVVAALAATPTARPGGAPPPAATGTPPAAATPTARTTPIGPASAATLLRSPGGSVTARCVGGNVRLDFWSPAPGYTVGEVRDDRVTFARGDDDEDEGEARVRCRSGTPVLEVKQD